jgi:hypothetical protein
MRTVLRYFVAVALTMLIASCSSMRSRPSVDIDIRNDSTNALNWVSLQWDGRKITAGVMIVGASSVYLDAGLPKSPKSDTVFIEFVDDKDGWTGKANSERKRYKVSVDASALKLLSAGHYRVTFSILSFTKARLQIQKKEK